MEILLTVAWVVGGLIVAFVLLALVAVIAIGGMASREEERRQEQTAGNEPDGVSGVSIATE
jgi:beta-lactamase regulating signal transducer with metallopeptidase domain